MDTTKAETNQGSEPRTLSDESRTVADSSSLKSKALVPAEIRDHELIRRIGQGSYGEVWLARNVMGTYRAVKIVYRAAFEHARPFEREFNGIQKFEPLSRSHDGFVDILQIGRTDDYFYYVMELADDVTAGQQIDPNRYEPKTLRSQVQGKKALPFEECVGLGLSLTQALGRLHEHGLIHRDIKPSNIIFVNGQPKLADIGLVAEQSEAKSFVGTEGFIPPEGPGTPQADIYSLGKVLYEIATGKDRHEFPALPTLLGDTTSDTHLLELNTVFLKACQSDLKQRYETAAQMRDDLLLLQSGKSVKRAQVVERRLSLLLRISVVGIAVTLLTLVAFLYARGQSRREARLRAQAQAGELQARRNLYVANMIVARHALQANNLGQAAELIDAYSASGGEDFRGFEWRYLRRLCEGDELRTFAGHAGPVTCLALSPGADVLITASFDGTIKRWDTGSGRFSSNLFSGTSSLVRNGLAPSPDGRLLAARMLNEVVLLDTERWQPRKRLPAQSYERADDTTPVVFSPDGKLLAATVAGGIRIWDLESFEVVRFFPGEAQTFGLFLAFCRDSKSLVVANAQTIRTLDVVSGRSIATWSIGKSPITSIAACLPSSLLAVSFRNGAVTLWDLKLGKEETTFQAHSTMCFGLATSPDGKLLATGGGDQLIRLWEISQLISSERPNSPARQSRQVEPIATLRGHGDQVWTLAFSSDGKQLVSGSKDATAKLWPLMPEKRERTLAGAWKPISFSADNRELLVANANRELYAWDIIRHQRGRLLDSPAALPKAESFQFSADNRFLVIPATNGCVQVWKADPWELMGTLPSVLGGDDTSGWNLGMRLRFSPDNQYLALSEGRSVKLWNTTSRQMQWTLTNSAYPVAFSPLGATLATAGNTAGSVLLWNIKEPGDQPRPVLLRTPQRQGATCLDFSSDGALLAVGNHDNTVWLYDLHLRKQRVLLKGHKSGITALRFSPDSKTLISGSTDGTVHFSYAVTGQELFDFKVFDYPIDTIQFSPDGTILAVGSLNPADPIHIWLAPSSPEISFHRANSRNE